MPQEVVMPDGQKVLMPDNPTPEQLQALSSLQAQKPTPWQQAKSAVKGVASDLARGALSGLSSMAEGAATLNAMDRPNWGRNASGQVVVEKPVLPEGEMTAGVRRLLPTPENDTKGRQYLRAGLEGVGGAAATGGVGPIGLFSGLTGGLGAQAGEDLFGDNALARFGGGLLGGLAGGGAAARIGRVRPQSATLAREALEGIDPKMISAAEQFQQSAAARNVQVDLAQALEAVGAPAANITTLRNFLANKKQGTQVQQLLQKQPGDLGVEASRTVGAMPGTNWGPEQAANNLQEAATGAVNVAKKARGDAVRELYGKATDLPGDARQKLIAVIEASLKEPGKAESVVASGKDLIRKLKGEEKGLVDAVAVAREKLTAAKTPSARAAAQAELAAANNGLTAAGTAPLRALDVDRWISEFAGPFKGTPLTPVDPMAAGQAKNLAKNLNTTFQDLSPEVKAAETRFADLTKSLVNPVKQSVTGQLATPRGYKPDVQASMQKFDALLERGVDPSAKVSSVRVLAKQLQTSDKEAFADALKSYVSRKIAQATEPGATGNTTGNNPDMAQRIADGLWGNTMKAQGLRDAVASAAESFGQNPQQAVKGLDNLMQLTRAAKNTTRVGGLQPQDIFQMGGKSYGADALRVFGIMPNMTAARRLEDAVLGKTLEHFDKILTSPEGFKMLAELAKQPVISKKAWITLGTMGAQLATNRSGVTEE